MRGLWVIFSTYDCVCLSQYVYARVCVSVNWRTSVKLFLYIFVVARERCCSISIDCVAFCLYKTFSNKRFVRTVHVYIHTYIYLVNLATHYFNICFHWKRKIFISFQFLSFLFATLLFNTISILCKSRLSLLWIDFKATGFQNFDVKNFNKKFQNSCTTFSPTFILIWRKLYALPA